MKYAVYQESFQLSVISYQYPSKGRLETLFFGQDIKLEKRGKSRKMGSPARVMVYKNKGYLAREQDAPTVLVTKNFHD